jgi:hypothetical protein
MDIVCNAVSDSRATAVGPLQSSVTADVQVADYDVGPDRFFSGDLYWIAYWNRRLTDTEVTNLQGGWVRPQNVPGVVAVWLFEQNVGVNYITEYGSYSFTVEGNPVRNGP